MSYVASVGVPEESAPIVQPSRKFAAILIGAAAGASLLAGVLVESGRGMAVLAFGVIAVPPILWRRPYLAPALIALLATTVEQFRYLVGTHNGAFTDRIPLYDGLTKGIHVNVVDLVLLALLALIMLQDRSEAESAKGTSPVVRAMAGLLAAVLLGFLVGQAHHGSLRNALTEIRPYVYLAASFFIARSLVTSKKAIDGLLWALVLGSGFKAAQGVVIFISARNLQPRPEAVLGHEEAFFFGLFILLTALLWMFQRADRLRTIATALLPIVLIADLVNSRRTSWLVLVGGLLVLAAIGFAYLPNRRSLLARWLVGAAVVFAIYLPLYWNGTGSLAQPARAIHSVISPDARDLSSDVYRQQENANLKFNIRQGGLFGKGFGVPIDYALPITNITNIDPLIAYVPHDGVLYILMRMGIVGGIAFWLLLATGVIGACRLARSSDRQLAIVGSLVACALIGFALQGYIDHGFFFYRVALLVGTLLGVAEAATRLRATDHSFPAPPIA